MLDSQKQLIRDSVPVLKQSGEVITKAFYKIMFEKYPEVQSMFDMEKQKSGKQPKALAMAILNAAQNIDNLEATIPQITKIGKVHVGLGVKKEHYPIVGECILLAIKEVLQEAATPELIEAWGVAYGKLADLYIKVEQDLYNKQ